MRRLTWAVWAPGSEGHHPRLLSALDISQSPVHRQPTLAKCQLDYAVELSLAPRFLKNISLDSSERKPGTDSCFLTDA